MDPQQDFATGDVDRLRDAFSRWSAASARKGRAPRDDACTEGGTIRAAAAALRARNPAVSVTAVTAGQMTVRAAVKHEADLIA